MKKRNPADRRRKERLERLSRPPRARNEYRIIFFGFRNRKVTISRAKSFQIFFGRKSVTNRVIFSPRQKSARSRENFVVRIVNEIEEDRQKRLARAYKRRRRLQREKLQREKLKEIPLPQTPTNANEEFLITSARILEGEYIEFNKMQVEPVRTLKSASEDFVSRTPIISLRPDEYEHQFYYKELLVPRGENIKLSILKWTLKKPIEMSSENFTEKRAEVFSKFYAYVYDFIMSTIRKSDGYILRVRFLTNYFDSEHAVSLRRTTVKNREQIGPYIYDTINRLMGEIPRMDLMTGYFADNQVLNITGFTLESEN